MTIQDLKQYKKRLANAKLQFRRVKAEDVQAVKLSFASLRSATLNYNHALREYKRINGVNHGA